MARRPPLIALVFILGVIPSFGWAQSSGSGGFSGIVIDSAGAVIPAAVITVSNPATGMTRSVSASERGFYSITGLPPGLYDVKAEFIGFATEIKRQTPLIVGTTLTLDFELHPAWAIKEVEEGGETALLETTQSEVKGAIQTRELENLPLLNRNFAGLVTLLPGIRPASPWDPTKITIGGLSISGSRGRNLNTTVDGGDSKDNLVGGLLQNFTLEGIQEFKVSMHRFSAVDGRSSGAELTIASKSGSNDLHGSGFLFARDAAFQAQGYFANRDNLEKPPFSRQQFGGSLGGPIRKSRTFLFGALEHIHEQTSVSVPTALYDEMVLLQPFGAKPVHAIPHPFGDTLYTIKLDYKIGERDSMMVRQALQLNDRGNDQIGANHDLSVPTFDENRLVSLVASETHLLGGRRLNQFTFQVSDFLNAIDSHSSSPATGNVSTPSISIGRAGISIRQTSFQRKLRFRDDFSLQAGKHGLRFGGDYAKFLKYGGYLNNGDTGTFTFFDDPSTIVADRGRYPQGFQTEGLVSSYSQATGQGDYQTDGAQQAAVYLQDDWRITRNLTLNLGMRYDVSVHFYDDDELSSNRTYLLLKKIGHPYAAGAPQTDKRNFAPRFGFAYDLGGRGTMVIRGGYGVYFDESFLSSLSSAIAQSKPTVYAVETRTNTNLGKGELATFRFGVDAPPTIPRAVDLPVGSTGQWVDPSYRNPYTQQSGIGFSRSFPNDLTFDVDYTHILGLREFRNYNLNPQVNGGARVLAPLFASVLGNAKALEGIVLRQSTNRSRYDELAVKFEKRGKRATFQASYILSRAYGYGGQAGDNSATAQDQKNIFAPSEWGPTGLDERHRVVVLGVFELPAWGIQFSPILQASSARPYNLTAGVDLNGDGTNNDRWIDPATGRQVSVNSERGDAFFLTDLRVTKFIKFKEKMQLGLFTEFFNLFDSTNFGANYNGNAHSTQFKQPVGYIGGAGYPFQAQFGARFSF